MTINVLSADRINDKLNKIQDELITRSLLLPGNKQKAYREHIICIVKEALDNIKAIHSSAVPAEGSVNQSV